MGARSYLLDTNIVVYCFDDRAPLKKRTAIELLQGAIGSASGLSYQAIQEFLNLATLPKPKFQIERLEAFLTEILFPLCRIMPSPELYSTAVRVRISTSCPFYDALHVAAAICSGVQILYSEDFDHGRRFENVVVINPFESTLH
jgi:predicted nucleic acid-binding protein